MKIVELPSEIKQQLQLANKILKTIQFEQGYVVLCANHVEAEDKGVRVMRGSEVFGLSLEGEHLWTIPRFERDDIVWPWDSIEIRDGRIVVGNMSGFNWFLDPITGERTGTGERPW